MIHSTTVVRSDVNGKARKAPRDFWQWPNLSKIVVNLPPKRHPKGHCGLYTRDYHRFGIQLQQEIREESVPIFHETMVDNN